MKLREIVLGTVLGLGCATNPNAAIMSPERLVGAEKPETRPQPVDDKFYLDLAELYARMERASPDDPDECYLIRSFSTSQGDLTVSVQNPGAHNIYENTEPINREFNRRFRALYCGEIAPISMTLDDVGIGPKTIIAPDSRTMEDGNLAVYGEIDEMSRARRMDEGGFHYPFRIPVPAGLTIAIREALNQLAEE